MLPWLLNKNHESSVVDLSSKKEEVSHLDARLETACELILEAIAHQSPEALKIALTKAHDLLHEEMDQPHHTMENY